MPRNWSGPDCDKHSSASDTDPEMREILEGAQQAEPPAAPKQVKKCRVLLTDPRAKKTVEINSRLCRNTVTGGERANRGK